MYKPINCLVKKILNIIRYCLIYVICTGLIIGIMILVYSKTGYNNPDQKSIAVYLGSAQDVDFLTLIQFTLCRLADILVFSGILASLLEPVNPIYFSDYFIYDNLKNKYRFRYWVMFREGTFLYNVTIKVFLTENHMQYAGINRIKPLWESEDPLITNLSMIRGMRIIELNEKDSEKLSAAISSHKEHKDSLRLNILISGETEKGKHITKMAHYFPEKCLHGYRFVPLQQRVYSNEEYFSSDSPEKITYNDGKNLLNYKHFNKVCAIINNDETIEADAPVSKQDIIECSKLKKKNYNAAICNIWNIIIMSYLDKSHAKRYFTYRK